MAEPIAIIGLGCVIPDAASPAAFWSNVLRGHSAVRRLSGGAWDWERYHVGGGADRSLSLLGARVEKHAFDWRRFRMPPAEAEAINPLQLMVLDAGAQAIDPVKVLPRERTGLFLGATGLGWQPDSGLRIRLPYMLDALRSSPAFASLSSDVRDAIARDAERRLDARLKPVTEDNVVGASASVAAGRIAMHYDFKGLHYSIDAGFASSLAALDVGVRTLRDGTLDMCVVGGVSELLTPLELVAFSRMGGLAAERVMPFDAAAEGTLLGEGAVIFVLKRLEDALRDGEHVHAVVLGVGGSSDGKGKSLVAPDAAGQALAMRRAYDDAGVAPESVSFVECHATGTPVGDASEVRALASVFGPGDRGTIALGSAKPFVGHLRAASGAVGLLRAVLALENGKVPGQIHFSSPSPALELEQTPFFIPTEAQELRPRPGTAAARAAVSAFGFGGANFHAVLERADPARRPVSVPARTPREPVAIVGMGGVMPGAATFKDFWRLLLDGKDTTREIPKDRWDIDRHASTDPNDTTRSYTRLGCFVDTLPVPDRRWKVPPAAFPSLDPSQLLILQSVDEALQDAGQAASWDASRVGVMLGFLPYQGKKFLADIRVLFTEFATELDRALRSAGVDGGVADRVVAETEAAFKAPLPSITEDTLTGYLGSVNAGRVTKLLDLHGPHFVVDSACASTHAALHAAIEALHHRTCDVVLSGGVWSDMMPEFFVAACRFNALSATGIKPFGENADGFVPGEGAGIFVLKRLSDAERAGDHIHAIIRSVAGGSDGKGRSVLAPNPAGEALAMQRAIAGAGIDPGDVDYVECHGTGTALGDVVEVDAMTRAYGTGRKRPLLIGSAKSNVGHLNAAAGVAGLAKAVMAVREGVIPPSLKADALNPQIDFSAGPVEVVRKVTPWRRPDGAARRAGVSGFGVGGTNMHLIVEQYVTGAAATVGSSSSESLPLAVGRGASLRACADALDGMARGGDQGFAARVVESQRAQGGPDNVRVAVVATDAGQLQKRVTTLRQAMERGTDLALLRQQGILVGMIDPSLKAAAVFPGQGPQYPNMLDAAATRFPSLRHTLARADDAYRAISGRALTPSFLGQQEGAWKQADEDIHCAVYAVNCALFMLLQEHGFNPAVVIGQSAGELSALVAAGVLSFEDGLRAVRERTLSVLEISGGDPGQMVALTCSASQAARMLEGLPGYAAVAADNAPSACIVSGATPAMAALVRRCEQEGIEAALLPVSHAYHSEMIAPARDRYLAFLRTLQFRAPRCEVISTITGGSITRVPPAELPELLASQFVRPVALQHAVNAAYAAGVRMFVECGPRWPLSTFIGEILDGKPHSTQPTIHPKVGEVEQLTRALGFLHVHGAGRLTTETAPVTAPAPTRDSLPPMPAPGAPDVGRLLDSIKQLIDGYLPSTNAGTTTSPHLQALAHAVDLIRSSLPPPSTSQPPPPPPAPPRPAVTQPRLDAVVPGKDVLALLTQVMARKTGYPLDMLEPDLDLEADLGIDTVKQVAIIGEVRTQLGLAQDPKFKLRDHRSLRQVAAYLQSRLGAATPPPPAAPVEKRPVTAAPMPAPSTPVAHAPPAKDVHAMLVAHVMKRTGYPAEMLDADLELEADLGIDTVKQVAIVGEVRAALGLAKDPAFKLREYPTLRKLAAYLESRMRAEHRSAPPAPSSDDGNAFERVRAMLVATLVKKTGYPVDMLDPDLDLEADLGIDTVKQVAVIGEVRTQLGLAADPAFKLRAFNTIRKVATHFAGRLGQAAPVAPTLTMPTVEAPPPRQVTTTTTPASDDAFATVSAVLFPVLMRKTGYPREMLELDLELEADLGIDTVKQVAVMGEARAQLGLPADPAFKLRDHSTLRKIIAYLASRVTTGRAPTPVAPTVTRQAPPAAPVDPWQVTGEPVSFTSRSPGTAFICGGSELRTVTPARCVQLLLGAAARELPADHRIAGVSSLRMGTPPIVEEASALRLQARLGTRSAQSWQGRVTSSSGVSHLELAIDLAAEGAPALVRAPTSVTAPVLAHGSGTSAQSLLEAVGRDGAAPLTWAHQPRFDTVVGGVALGRGEGRADPAALIATVVDAAFLLASFGWYAGTGAFHVLARVDRVRLFTTLPGDGAYRMHVRLYPPAGGRWRADAVLLNDALEQVASVEGLVGAQLGDAARPVFEELMLDGAALGWQRFFGRVTSPPGTDEDPAW